MTRPIALYDDEAEHHLATISLHGAQLALERVEGHHFHDPRAWWVIVASAGLPHDIPGDDPDPIDRRIEAVSVAAGLYPALLRQWVAETPAMVDTGGLLADRVLAAYRHRQRAQSLVDGLEQLGIGIEWKAAG